MPRQSIFAVCNFGLPVQKSTLHVCHLEGTCKLVAREYQVAL